MPLAVVLGALLALVALLLAGCGATAAADGVTTTLAPDQRQDTPAVTGTTLDGKPFDLTAWRGKVVVVNFWGSWCVTCREEAGALERTYTDLKGDGVRFLGVATRDTADNARAFLRTFPMSYPSLLDDPATNTVLLAFRGQLPVASTPTTYVLDRDGRIAARTVGTVDGDRLRAMIDPVLAEQAS